MILLTYYAKLTVSLTEIVNPWPSAQYSNATPPDPTGSQLAKYVTNHTENYMRAAWSESREIPEISFSVCVFL